MGKESRHGFFPFRSHIELSHGNIVPWLQGHWELGHGNIVPWLHRREDDYDCDYEYDYECVLRARGKPLKK